MTGHKIEWKHARTLRPSHVAVNRLLVHVRRCHKLVASRHCPMTRIARATSRRRLRVLLCYRMGGTWRGAQPRHGACTRQRGTPGVWWSVPRVTVIVGGECVCVGGMGMRRGQVCRACARRHVGDAWRGAGNDLGCVDMWRLRGEVTVCWVRGVPIHNSQTHIHPEACTTQLRALFLCTHASTSNIN